MTTLAQRWMGRGNNIKEAYTLEEKLAGAIDITRPILTTMGALGVASAAALANGGFPAWNLCLVGFVAALLAFAGIHSFNDFIDTRRDQTCWPGRPIPSRRLSSNQGLLFSVSTFIVSLVLVRIFFNPTCFYVSLVALSMGCLYSAYLRDRVGYLVLPPIQGILWLCGWTAFSPGTLFTSMTPWVLYLLSIAWQSGHIMIYSPLHPTQKIKGVKLTQVPALFFKTSPKTAATLGFGFLCVALGMAIYLSFYANLGLIYLIPVILMGLIALVISYNFMKNAEDFGRGIKAFTYATYFMTVIRVCILLSVLLFF
jgi:4-hydroxybenzoate polyprenyltransferase